MKRKNKISCKWVPQVPGTTEDSKLYIELSKLIKNRPLTNLVYASYLQDGVADKMTSLGYVVNKQGQHRAKDVYAIFDVGSMKNALPEKSLSKTYGFVDASENLVDYDAVEAYNKAQAFNNEIKGRVAYVVQHGDKFNILLDERNSRTLARLNDVNRGLSLWSTLSEELTKRGIDINELNEINPGLVNPGTVASFIKNLGIYKYTPTDGLSVKDIEMLLALNHNVPIAQNILSRGWGSREETAQRMYDALHSTTATQTTINLVTNVLEQAKQLPKLDIKNLREQLNTALSSLEKVDEGINIEKTIQELDKAYHLESDVFVREDSMINRFSEATADAIMSLQRQIRNIEIKSGRTAKSESLRTLESKLSEELRTKQYAEGLSDFMKSALVYIKQINNNLNNLNLTGSNLDVAHTIADATTQAQNLREAYYSVINALATRELVNDFAINDADKTVLKDLANSLKQIFDSQYEKIKDLQKEAMLSIGKEFIGEHNALYSKDLVDIISMSEADASLTDYLYSIGRSSNTVISMLGAIIRDAQATRDTKYSKIALEIRRANHKLSKDGKTSAFMYDEKGRIVSQYDWDAYFKAKSEYSRNLQRAGFKRNTMEFEAEMQLWEDSHTTEVVVDHESGRAERMPNFYLLNNFRAGWSKAQNEYYDTMMELKGQIGTLLPNYAQHQYIAPQKRISWDQVLKEGIQGKRSFDDMARWFLRNSRFWKMKEADTRFRSSGIYVEGEESLASLSSYDNTVLRQIPIFYIKKIDAGNLSHDFSSAIQDLAGTALNYEAMDGIKNIAEMMTDYSTQNSAVEKDALNRPKVDIVRSNGINVVKNLRKHTADNRTSTILDSFVLKHIYGVENKSEGLWAVLCANLIGYTSLKGLAVNVKGALTNKAVGILQTLIKASGGQYYNFKDLAKASAILTGTEGFSTTGAILGGVVGGAPGAAIGLAIGTAAGAKEMTGKIMDILTNNKNSKDSLIAEFFNEAQENFSNYSNTRYHSTMFGKLFGHFEPMAMYQRGEYWIHMLNVYSVLLHEKVVSVDPATGKKNVISLYEALEKGEKIDGNSELKLKDNIYRIDGKKLEGLSDDYFKAITRRIRYVNQQCHGSMNKEDKGLINQWMIGKLTMNFRQWMVEHYSRRFRALHWDESIRDVDLSNFYTHTRVLLDGKKVKLIDALNMVDNNTGEEGFHYEIKQKAKTLDGKALTNEVLDAMLNKYAEDSGWRRGFKVTAVKTFIDFVKEAKEYETSASSFWNNLSETQKADVKQTLSEAFLLMSLAGLSACMGDPNDHKGEWFFRLWMYIIKRCLFDTKATSVIGLPTEAKTLINSPIASVQTAAGLLYPIVGLLEGDASETIKSGRYKGWNKYERNVLKYTIPFYSQIDQLLNIGEDPYIFGVFGNQITR